MPILHGQVGGVFAAIPVFNQLVPNEGPRSIFMEMDFSVADEYTFDLQQEIAEGIIWGVQSFYYDNSLNNSDVIFESDITGQRMTFQARWQGYRPMLLTNPPRGKFNTSTGSGPFRVLMLNVPMPFGEWLST